MKPTAACLLTLAASLSCAGAAFTAIGNAPTAGNQEFGGSLGSDFIVHSSISVTQLGVFDDNVDGINRNLGAAIFQRNDGGTPLTAADDTGGALVVEALFDSGDPGVLSGSYRFKDITTVTLTPGAYTIVGWGYGAGERNGNDGGVGNWPTTIDDGGGSIEFVGVSRFGDPGAAGTWPTTPDGGPPVRYGAGNFVYVPEPSAVGLLALSLASLVLRRKRG